MYSLTIIHTEPFLFEKLAYLCVYAVTLIGPFIRGKVRRVLFFLV